MPHRKLLQCLLPVAGLLSLHCILLSNLQAQEAQANTQAKESARDLLRKQMELQLQEQEKLLPPDEEDLGEQIIIKRKPKKWNITLATDLGENWSSNVLQSETGTQADFALTHNDVVNASYKLNDELTLSGSYRFTVYRYHRLIAQNFDAHNASGSFSYTLPYNFNLGGGMGWTTIYSRPIDDSVYEEADFNGSLSRVIPLEFNDWFKQHTAAFVGYQVDYRLASPKDLDKLENAPYAGFFCALNPQLNGQLVYRWNYQHFQVGGRKDYNSSLSANATWTPYPWMAVSVYSSYTDNNSVGKDSRNYSVNNTGVTARFSWKF